MIPVHLESFLCVNTLELKHTIFFELWVVQLFKIAKVTCGPSASAELFVYHCLIKY